MSFLDGFTFKTREIENDSHHVGAPLAHWQTDWPMFNFASEEKSASASEDFDLAKQAGGEGRERVFSGGLLFPFGLQDPNQDPPPPPPKRNQQTQKHTHTPKTAKTQGGSL